MKLSLVSPSGRAELELSRTPEGLDVVRDGQRKSARVLDESGARLVFELDGHVQRAHVLVQGDTIRVLLRGRESVFRIGGAAAATADGGGEGAEPVLRATLPGRVLKIVAEVGAQVRAGDPVLLIEAMKMENPIVAEADGTVAEIHVEQGEMVQVGQPLATCRYTTPSAVAT